MGQLVLFGERHQIVTVIELLVNEKCFRPLDFAPAQAGAIFAVTNTVANLSGFLAPQTTGHLLNIEDSLSQWQV